VQHGLRGLLAWIADGESVAITRNRQVVAWIMPPPVSGGKIRMPDFVSRMQREYPHSVATDKQAANLVDAMRGER
jgi:antitoxin (DNA-binding transcriptional repressor) of toxin-antitoxin stability system